VQAEAAVRGAVEAARAAARRPPIEAFGALIEGYAREQQLQPALGAFRAFLRMGGRPHRTMLDNVVGLCLKAGEVRWASQVRTAQVVGLCVGVRGVGRS
jgi:hypothetical protein